MTNSTVCPSDNAPAVDDSVFWGPNGPNWSAHTIGWAVSGGCALVTVLVSLVSVLKHCLHYTCPPEQRQILRILYMPPFYAVVSFCSYRFIREYIYFDLGEAVYQSITLSAFLLLLIEYAAATASARDIKQAIEQKDKRKLPLPFCCWRYRATKGYFLYTLKWAVLQYVIIRPLLSIVGVIARQHGVLCESGSWSFRSAKVYITIVDLISNHIRSIGLSTFYELVEEELQGRRPLAKFRAIDWVFSLITYQSLIFSALEGRVIHATEYWTATNIVDGLSALAICIEMMFLSLFMLWAYSWKEYKIPGERLTKRIYKPLWDSINYSDFLLEVLGSLKYFFNRARGHDFEENKVRKGVRRVNFEEAFGLSAYPPRTTEVDGCRDGGYDDSEGVRLAPYAYTHSSGRVR